MKFFLHHLQHGSQKTLSSPLFTTKNALPNTCCNKLTEEEEEVRVDGWMHKAQDFDREQG